MRKLCFEQGTQLEVSNMTAENTAERNRWDHRLRFEKFRSALIGKDKSRQLESSLEAATEALAAKEKEMEDSMAYLENQFDAMREKMQAQVAVKDLELERLRAGMSPREAAIASLANDLEEYHSPRSVQNSNIRSPGQARSGPRR